MQFFDNNTKEMTFHVESVLKSFATTLQGRCESLNKKPKIYKKNNLAQFFKAEDEPEEEDNYEFEETNERRLYSASFLDVQNFTVETQTSSNETTTTTYTGDSNNEGNLKIRPEELLINNERGVKNIECFSSEEEIGDVD